MYAALFSGDRDSQVMIDEFAAVIGELIVQPDRSYQESQPNLCSCIIRVWGSWSLGLR